MHSHELPLARAPAGPAAGVPNNLADAVMTGALGGELIDVLPVGVYWCDRDGALVRWNRSAVALWGRDPAAGDREERFCGSHALYRMDGTFLPHADGPVAGVLRTGEAQRNVEIVIER
ncbi:MAG TPA: PAS domain-containing protein, partial [Burkholderiales bacterium]|nr:PAS domain-containing protein [Burkholderiales bacterium]